jgi:DNA-binding transcriptional ArsR family regulator
MTDPLSAVLVALADPTRRDVMAALVDAGTATATALAGRLPVTRQAVDKHLRVLAEAGLVAGTRAGREVRWTARPEVLDESARALAQLAARWDRRLRALKAEAEG